MSNKLLPPQIETTLPAFAGTKLIVPAKMNKAVSFGEISGFKCRIKAAIENEQKGIVSSTKYNINGDNIDIEFDISSLNLMAGQFYKIQLAYYIEKQPNEIVGFFSTVGIIKYCQPAKLSIFAPNELNIKKVNQENTSYLGVYQSDDAGEKVFQYKFDLYDENKKIIETTDWQLHNTMTDTQNNSSNDIFIPKLNFEKNKMYYLQYSVITVNKLNIYTDLFKIMSYKSIESNLKCELQVEGNSETASIDIFIKPLQNNNIEIMTGSFVLSKLNTIDNQWNDIYYFNLLYENPFKLIFTDYVIEQNKEYLYSIRQYNENNIYSERIISNSIKVDFEDMFLFDGKKQLTIKFNPKVSSFKNVVLEQKVNTIGNKYPYIVKNGYVNYKDFPISGLLSYKEDNRREFIDYPSQSDKNRNETKSLYNSNIINLNDTNLTADNIYLERQFKLNILDWLTNGKPKLFKSPTEGNYIVRLLNVNLTPNDTLGRMIHTFSCNASEVAKCSYNDLVNNDIISKENITKPAHTATKWVTIPLMKINEQGLAEYCSNEERTININPAATTILFDDFTPGNKFILNDNLEIVIGSTGSYSLENIPINKIYLADDTNKYYGSITYTVPNALIQDSFSLIKETVLHNVPVQQIFGFQNNLNILQDINNIKDEIIKLNRIVFSKIDFNNLDLFGPNIDIQNIKETSNSYKIKIIYDDSSEELDLKDVNDLRTYSFNNMKAPKEIYLGNGICCELSYCFMRKTYSIETKTNDEYEKLTNQERQNYLNNLSLELKKYKEEHGIE